MHDHKNCTHAEAGPELERKGARLQDGLAHTLDHAIWTRRDFMTRLGLGAAAGSLMLNGTPVSAFAQSPVLEALNQQ